MSDASFGNQTHASLMRTKQKSKSDVDAQKEREAGMSRTSVFKADKCAKNKGAGSPLNDITLAVCADIQLWYSMQ